MLGVLDANRDCGLKRTWDLCLFRAEAHFTPCGLNVVFLVDQPPCLLSLCAKGLKFNISSEVEIHKTEIDVLSFISLRERLC